MQTHVRGRRGREDSEGKDGRGPHPKKEEQPPQQEEGKKKKDQQKSFCHNHRGDD